MSFRTKQRSLLAVALTASVTLAACEGRHPETQSSSPSSVEARLGRAELVEIPQTVEIAGTVEASQVAAVAARVMAMVTAVHVKAGEEVRRGQLLLDIDPETSAGQLSQARGALSQAQAALALAERNYQRFQALAAERAASELEVDMARMQFEQASGAVEQAQGAVAAASSVAADARVTAPFDGRVAQKMVEVGDLASPGRPLMMLESIAGRRLVVAVPETLMQQSNLRTGDTLTVRIDSRPDLGALQGAVGERTPGADPATHSVQVKVDLPVAVLTTGAAGRAWIQTGARSAVTVPRDAVLQQGGLSLVVLRTAEGIAASRVVTVGRELANDRVEILSGLTGGETVLTGLATPPPSGANVEALS